MDFYPVAIEKLIEEFAKLPKPKEEIGYKSIDYNPINGGS